MNHNIYIQTGDDRSTCLTIECRDAAAATSMLARLVEVAVATDNAVEEVKLPPVSVAPVPVDVSIKCDDKHPERMKLYAQGKTDREIAELTGSTQKAIATWRAYRKLPPNPAKRGPKPVKMVVPRAPAKRGRPPKSPAPPKPVIPLPTPPIRLGTAKIGALAVHCAACGKTLVHSAPGIPSVLTCAECGLTTTITGDKTVKAFVKCGCKPWSFSSTLSVGEALVSCADCGSVVTLRWSPDAAAYLAKEVLT